MACAGFSPFFGFMKTDYSAEEMTPVLKSSDFYNILNLCLFFKILE